MIWSDIMYFKNVNHPDVQDGYIVDEYGNIRKTNMVLNESIDQYISTNGYNYIKLNEVNGKQKLFPVDDIVAIAFVRCPDELIGKPVKVEHIDGNLRNNHYENLRWVEDIEEWRDITYPGIKTGMYEISSFGNVRNKITKVIMKPDNNKGYFRYGFMTGLVRNKKSLHKHASLHRLMVYEFLHFDTDLVINHIDGCKTNNIPKNLEPVTSYENKQHALYTGLDHNIGDSHWHAHFSNDDIRHICEVICENDGDVDKTHDILIKEGLNIKRATIKAIIHKLNWTSISDEYFKFHQFRQQASEQDIEILCKILIKNNMNIDISLEEFNEKSDHKITRKVVISVVKKYRWQSISDKYF